MDPGYSVEDEARDRADDRTQLIKVRAMVEALMRELKHPMHTKKGIDAMHWCEMTISSSLEVALVDELNPTIEALE